MKDRSKNDAAASGTGKRVEQRVLWLGFVAVALPLALLLVLQYRWLSDLQETSSIARRVAQERYLTAVTDALEGGLRREAERVLNAPIYLLEKPPEKARKHFVKKSVPGARHFFLLGFDQGSLELIEPPADDETERAVYQAAWHWKMQAKKEVRLERTELKAHDEEPGARIITNPLTDDTGRIVGVAGMVVDEQRLKKKALPWALGKALPGYPEEWRVEVRDGEGRLVFGEAAASAEAAKAQVSRPFSLLFRDWRIGLESRSATPEQWARTNFLLNMSLSVGLALVLLAGLALALRTASRAMALSEMKNDFVSNVSHELRTPLASIRVFGELLRHGKVEGMEKVREYGDYIETEGRRLSQLINNILDFSKIESGQKVYRREATDLEELVAGTLETFRVRSRHTGHRIELSGPDSPLPPLELDPGAIRQALANLLDNAVKYSDGGSRIQVRLRARRRSVELAVRDEGMGIAKDQQAQIFDRFHRVPTGLVHDVKGSGLGLAIVRHIAEAHGGGVAVESEPGRGSTFTLSLPIASPAVGESAGPALEGSGDPLLESR